MTPFILLFVLYILAACGPRESGAVDIQAVVRTQPVSHDADDPAIWVHPTDPALSLIIGTNKAKTPGGALVVFGLDGRTRQTVDGLDHPNNVDIEYGLNVGGRRIDIAVVTERKIGQLRIFQIAPDGSGISDVSSPGNIRASAGPGTDPAAPMGISLYRRPRDGVIFAIVSLKRGAREGYLRQYRLEEDGQGRVKATFVRQFGKFSGAGEIEAVAVDDTLGYVYYADEGDGIHKYHADPDHPNAASELAHFGRTGFRGDREGIAIYERRDGTGYIVCTDQIDRDSEYRIYRREGEPGRPHDHTKLLKIVRGKADATDGIEITSQPLGSKFPAGLMVAMNSRGRNFYLFPWEEVAGAGQVKLAIGE